MLNVADLEVDDSNVRLHMDSKAEAEQVQRLAEDIKKNDLINPLTVRPKPDAPGKYSVMAGGRRLQAVKTLGWDKVECSIRDNLSDTDAIYVSLSENLVKGEITARELGHGIERAMEMAQGGDVRRRREVALRLGWKAPTTGKPDITRIKRTIRLGRFNAKLPGVVIKSKTRGDRVHAGNGGKIIAWTTAERLMDLVEDPIISERVRGLGPEKYEGFVVRLADAFTMVAAERRKTFSDRLKADPTRSPEEIATEIEQGAIKSQLLSFRVDPGLYGTIVQQAAREGVTKTEWLLRAAKERTERMGSVF